MTSKAQKAVKGLRVIGAVFTSDFWGKLRANRQAKKAGRPKPYTAWELFGEVVATSMDSADVIRGENTPAERPSRKP